MTAARLARLLGQALVWTVMAVAAGTGLVVALPVLAVAALGRGVYELVWLVIGHAEPDGLDDVLRGQIDGDVDDADVLMCGCPRDGRLVAGCMDCDWVTCMGHAREHLCEPDDDANEEPSDTHIPVGAHFALWEDECTGLRKWSKKLGGAR